MIVEPNVREAGRAAAFLSKSLEVALGEAGLSLPQYRLLAFLSGGPERATELASWLDVSPPSLTALVDGLVAKGLVQRVASEEDRRCVRHMLTPDGIEALADGDTAVIERLRRITEVLTVDQAREVVVGLELIGDAMDMARAQQDAAKGRPHAGSQEVGATR